MPDSLRRCLMTALQPAPTAPKPTNKPGSGALASKELRANHGPRRARMGDVDRPETVAGVLPESGRAGKGLKNRRVIPSSERRSDERSIGLNALDRGIWGATGAGHAFAPGGLKGVARGYLHRHPCQERHLTTCAQDRRRLSEPRYPVRGAGGHRAGTARARSEPEIPASARTRWIPRTSRRRRGTPAAPDRRRAG
jgi:hypothetical protein